MTSKKRRQRGSRTHGGGTHKNRRGAGHRGGRGDAGRDKHEFHNYPPLGKHGFSRPQSVQAEVRTINARTLDEDAALLAADGLAEAVDGGYRVDAREVVEDGFEADAVKVLGGGQVRGELEVVADAFSSAARQLIEEAGGEAVLSDRAEPADDAGDAAGEGEAIGGADAGNAGDGEPEDVSEADSDGA